MEEYPTELFPAGWAQAVFGDICTIRNGYAFKSKDFVKSGVPLVKQGNLTGSEVDLSNCAFLPLEYIDEYPEFHVSNGDILIGMSGSLGEPSEYRNSEPALQNQRTGLVRPTPAGDRTFVRYFLEYSQLQLVKRSKGMAIQNISAKDIEAIPLALPPLNEQHRIVEKIETLFVRLDKGEETLREVQKLLARYRQSVLKAAVTGQLTADWRAENAHRLEHGRDLLARILQTRRETWEGRGKYKEPAAPDTTGLPDLPGGWVWTSLSQLTNIKGGVTVDKKREASDPVTLPYLRVANVQNGFLDLREIKEITVNRDKADQCLLQPGDILLNEGGDRDKLGRGWVWNGEISPCIHQNHVYRARPVLEEVSSKFISYYANAFGQPFFMQKGKQSVNLASISLSAISGLPIPLPSVEEQTEIVIAIEEKLAEIAIAAEACGSQLTRSAALRQSILKDAFAGRLVPQDPTDEPASELLARIRAERGAGPTTRARRRVNP